MALARREAQRLAAQRGCEVRILHLQGGNHAFYLWPQEGADFTLPDPPVAHSWDGMLTLLQRAAPMAPCANRAPVVE